MNLIKKEKSVHKLYYSLITNSVQRMCILVFFGLYAYYKLDCLMIYATNVSIEKIKKREKGNRWMNRADAKKDAKKKERSNVS